MNRDHWSRLWRACYYLRIEKASLRRFTMLAGRLLLVVAISALVFLGCSNSKLPPGAKPTKKVSVVVLYKGAPVEGASVTFVNSDGPPPANGRTDAQGKAVMKTYL